MRKEHEKHWYHVGCCFTSALNISLHRIFRGQIWRALGYHVTTHVSSGPFSMDLNVGSRKPPVLPVALEYVLFSFFKILLAISNVFSA